MTETGIGIASTAPRTFRDFAELLWLPLLIGGTTAAATWLIWYYTSVPCPPAAAMLHNCNPSLLAKYINVDIWARCLTLGVLAGGLIGGGVNYAMFSRERAARIAAETMLAEERKHSEEERRRSEEERRLREEDRKRIDQLVETQQSIIQQLVENQQAVTSALTALTDELSEMRRQRNGN